MTRPVCKCHGEPMARNGTTRTRKPNWLCRRRAAQRANAYYHANRDRILQNHRDRYDNDPIHRISHLLHQSARKRAESLKQRKERHGQVQAEG